MKQTPKETATTSPTSTSTQTHSTASPERVAVEVLAAQSGEKPYLLAAAYADNNWLPGQELTGKEFSDALKRVKGQVI